MDKDVFTEKVRAVIAIMLTLLVVGLAAAIVFCTIPKDNQQMANSIIMFLLGMLAGATGYYFSASPVNRKLTTDTTTNIIDSTEINTTPGDTK